MSLRRLRAFVKSQIQEIKKKTSTMITSPEISSWNVTTNHFLVKSFCHFSCELRFNIDQACILFSRLFVICQIHLKISSLTELIYSIFDEQFYATIWSAKTFVSIMVFFFFLNQTEIKKNTHEEWTLLYHTAYYLKINRYYYLRRVLIVLRKY